MGGGLTYLHERKLRHIAHQLALKLPTGFRRCAACFSQLLNPLAARPLWLGVALAHEIERHCGADEILQRCPIELVAFMDVDGSPDIPVQTGIE